MVARAERSPGSGPPLAFPVAQWRCERSVLPVTVAGPRRILTGFRASALATVSVVAKLCLGRLRSKPRRQISLELFPGLLVLRPFFR